MFVLNTSTTTNTTTFTTTTITTITIQDYTQLDLTNKLNMLHEAEDDTMKLVLDDLKHKIMYQTFLTNLRSYANLQKVLIDSKASALR